MARSDFFIEKSPRFENIDGIDAAVPPGPGRTRTGQKQERLCPISWGVQSERPQTLAKRHQAVASWQQTLGGSGVAFEREVRLHQCGASVRL
jgi:hypothetical protein